MEASIVVLQIYNEDDDDGGGFPVGNTGWLLMGTHVGLNISQWRRHNKSTREILVNAQVS